MSEHTKSCTVVGAGISGLLASNELARSGWQVTVLDKGRGVGGRMATRRFGGGTFDHGTQFFTARSDLFQSLVEGWMESGAVTEWSRGFAGAKGERPPDGHPRYRGSEGMTSVAKSLARDLDVRTGELVESITKTDSGWKVSTESGMEVESGALLMTPPAPQALDLTSHLLEAETVAALRNITYTPCFALMVLLESELELPEPGGIQVKDEPLDWISNNQTKGISDAPGLTIHAGPEWSAEHIEDSEEAVTKALLGFAGEHLGTDLRRLAIGTSLAPWRYSMVTSNHPERFLVGSNSPPLVFCGDGFGEAKVEGASLSGLAGAAWLTGRANRG